MNKPQNLNAFKTRNDRFSYIFIYLNQWIHIPEAWKSYPFRAEPSRPRTGLTVDRPPVVLGEEFKTDEGRSVVVRFFLNYQLMNEAEYRP